MPATPTHSNGNGAWKTIAAVLVGLSALIAVLRPLVSNARDSGLLDARVAALESSVSRYGNVSDQVVRIGEQISSFKVQLNTQLDALNSRVGLQLEAVRSEIGQMKDQLRRIEDRQEK